MIQGIAQVLFARIIQFFSALSSYNKWKRKLHVEATINKIYSKEEVEGISTLLCKVNVERYGEIVHSDVNILPLDKNEITVGSKVNLQYDVKTRETADLNLKKKIVSGYLVFALVNLGILVGAVALVAGLFAIFKK